MTLRDAVCALTLIALFTASFPMELVAEQPEPQLCLGYDPSSGHWGVVRAGRESNGLCPPNHAFAGSTRPSPRTSWPSFWGTCCPLPEGVLGDEQRIVESDCPESFVATGVVSQRADSPDPATWRLALRCQRLRPDRYRLGPVIRGSEFDLTIGAMYYIRAALGIDPPAPPPIRWAELPAGIRYALGRTGQYEWSWNGCVPSPPGALLTGWRGSSCSQQEFRRVIAVNDDSGGEHPLSVIPECRTIDSPLSPGGRCVR